MNNKIRQAVSIIFIFKDEVFFIKRQNFLKAFPGYTAFPGGKVDKEDVGSNFSETLFNTLVRETKEELGVNIRSHAMVDKIEKIAKATSPDFNPFRYETYFFIVKLKSKIEFQVDQNEAAEFGWRTPDRILTEYNTGNRLMVGPVREIYKKLSDNINEFNYIDLDSSGEQKIPSIEFLKNVKQVIPLSNTIFPATRTNSFLIGDEQKVLVDPSPKNQKELALYLNEIKKFRISKIFITHHHKDHHQFSTDLAKELKVPIFISKDSYLRIIELYGDKYFQNIKVNYCKNGDVIGSWLSENIEVYEIPGHDEGHLGLAPTSLKWFIVGDLFQGIGTVVVGGDEGDMRKYLQSLQKVIKLKPNCVIPSHGIPLGGTNILKKTHDHRIMREKQVLDLSKQGKNIKQILDIIYFNLPSGILKYAVANIESHIKKLKEDGLL